MDEVRISAHTSTKLTLTINKDIIESAKRYAQSKGRSLSDLVENYLKSLSGKEASQNEISPRIRRLIGAVKLPADTDYKEELTKNLYRSAGQQGAFCSPCSKAIRSGCRR